MLLTDLVLDTEFCDYRKLVTIVKRGSLLYANSSIVTPPTIGEQSVAMTFSVCPFVCLSVREHISGTRCPIFTKFISAYYIYLWLGLLLATLRYFMYFRFYG